MSRLKQFASKIDFITKDALVKRWRNERAVCKDNTKADRLSTMIYRREHYLLGLYTNKSL